MPTSTEWLIYLGVTIIIVITPGPGMIYVLARSLNGGLREGTLSALGNALGVLVHVVAAALGLSALLAASPVAFTAVKLAGAGYLVYLGAQAIRHRNVGCGAGLSAGRHATRGTGTRSAVRQGVVVQVLNPKTTLFFMALLPQFVHAERAAPALVFTLLGVVAVILALTVELMVAVAAGRARDRLIGRTGWQARQRTVGGCLMIGLGAFVAMA
ncbi:LysE family translocator [Phytoactinopolyspora limicola]|uniref:LysE family translocator n=1 Tax=Phytoactinopolyspora limicola TaxID=2715536 RepID=UPI0014090207|nr:LysE family translocator [Phytoactinopolyspora limicola]